MGAQASGRQVALGIHGETVVAVVEHEPGSVGRGVRRRMVILQPAVDRGVFCEARLGHCERSVSGRVMFLGCLRAGNWSAAVENGPYVGARLSIWRDAVVAPHGSGPGVVGGQGEHGPELVGEAAQVGDAGVDVLPGVEGIGDAEVALRARHQLHQALGAGGRLRGCAVPGLDGDDGVHQAGVDAVPLGGRGDDVGERRLAGLGRSREEAGGGKQQEEHDATVGEMRQRHGERVTYHIEQGSYTPPDIPPADRDGTAPERFTCVGFGPLGRKQESGPASVMPENEKHMALRCAGVFG